MNKSLNLIILFLVSIIYFFFDVLLTEDLNKTISRVIILLFIGLVIFRLSSRNQVIYPLVSLAIVYHLLAFIWPIAVGKIEERYIYSAEVDSAAVGVVVLGLAGILIGASLNRKLYRNGSYPFRTLLERNKIERSKYWFILALFLWAIVLVVKSTLRDSLSLDALLNLFKALSLSLFTGVIFSKEKNSKIQISISIVIIIYELIVGVAGGLLAIPVFLIVQVFAIRYYFKRNISGLDIIAIIITLLIIFIFQNVKTEYRARYWGVVSELTPADRASAFARLAFEEFSFTLLTGARTEISDSFEQRASNVSTLKSVIELTPGYVPYKMGETLKPLLYSWIPRIFWPDKPQAQLGNLWAKEYNLLELGNYDTSYNLPWLVEFYMNFGLIGVFLGMGIAGYLFGVIEQIFFSDSASPYVYLVGVALVSRLWWLESNISLTLGNFLIQFIVVVVISALWNSVSVKSKLLKY